MPAATIPDFATEIIAAIQNLAELDVAELGDGQERGVFHFDGQAAFIAAAFDFGHCLAVKGIGGPGRPLDKGNLLLGKHIPDDLGDGGLGSNPTTGGDIMIRRPFIAQCHGGHHHVPHGELLLQRSCPTNGDDLANAVADEFFDQGTADRPTHTGVH